MTNQNSIQKILEHLNFEVRAPSTNRKFQIKGDKKE